MPRYAPAVLGLILAVGCGAGSAGQPRSAGSLSPAPLPSATSTWTPSPSPTPSPTERVITQLGGLRLGGEAVTLRAVGLPVQYNEYWRARIELVRNRDHLVVWTHPDELPSYFHEKPITDRTGNVFLDVNGNTAKRIFVLTLGADGRVTPHGTPGERSFYGDNNTDTDDLDGDGNFEIVVGEHETASWGGTRTFRWDGTTYRQISCHWSESGDYRPMHPPENCDRDS